MRRRGVGKGEAFYFAPRMQQSAEMERVNIERDTDSGSNIIVASQFPVARICYKELLSRSRRIYCILSRAISSLESFWSASRMGAKEGGGGEVGEYGRNTSRRARLVSVCETLYPAWSERERHCHGSRAFFMFAFPRNNGPRPRDHASTAAVHVPRKMEGTHWTRDEKERWPHNTSTPR